MTYYYVKVLSKLISYGFVLGCAKYKRVCWVISDSLLVNCLDVDSS